MIESYTTISAKSGPFEFKEKGSRFISLIFPVTIPDEAETIVRQLWKEHYDATHIVYAYRMGKGTEQTFRYNDDGEPNGTAGIPVFNEIKRAALFDVLVVSIRYYGGTKLGTGGLTRAYGQSARLAVEQCEKKEVFIKDIFSVSIPFSFTGDMMYIINSIAGVDIVSQEYSESGTTIQFAIPVRYVENFNLLLIDKSKGQYALK